MFNFIVFLIATFGTVAVCQLIIWLVGTDGSNKS
jgi:hypothetical protein